MERPSKKTATTKTRGLPRLRLVRAPVRETNVTELAIPAAEPRALAVAEYVVSEVRGFGAGSLGPAEPGLADLDDLSPAAELFSFRHSLASLEARSAVSIPARTKPSASAAHSAPPLPVLLDVRKDVVETRALTNSIVPSASLAATAPRANTATRWRGTLTSVLVLLVAAAGGYTAYPAWNGMEGYAWRDSETTGELRGGSMATTAATEPEPVPTEAVAPAVLLDGEDTALAQPAAQVAAAAEAPEPEKADAIGLCGGPPAGAQGPGQDPIACGSEIAGRPIGVLPADLWMSCERGDARHCLVLGHLYAGGFGPLNKDADAAMQAYGQGCELGTDPTNAWRAESFIACRMLAELLRGAADPGEAELARARDLDEWACENGNVDACIASGQVFHRQLDGPDFKKALRYYGAGCEMGGATACNALAAIQCEERNPRICRWQEMEAAKKAVALRPIGLHHATVGNAYCAAGNEAFAKRSWADACQNALEPYLEACSRVCVADKNKRRWTWQQAEPSGP